MTPQRCQDEAGPSSTQTRELPKVATGIMGLDEVLNGGLPEGRTTLISGGPGSGKSLVGLEFLYRGAVAGNPGIFVTFEERADPVRQNARTMDWDLAPLEQDGKFFLMAPSVDPETVTSGDFSVKGLLAILEGKATAMGARRIVVDAVDVLMRLFDDPRRERNELYILHNWLMDHEMTAVLSAKRSADPRLEDRYEFLDFMADCVIHLDQRVAEQVPTRRVRVLKYRGSSYGRNEYPFVITAEGVRIMSLAAAELQHRPLAGKISSGHPRLDSVMNGGYIRGSSILITGTSGTGKTTLASTFVRAACERDEKVLYIDFEESADRMMSGMLSAGIDLRPAREAGRLQYLTGLPEAMGAEEHLIRAFRTIETFQPEHVVVDAISACSRMGSEQAAFEYVMRLVNTCAERDITVFLINQTDGFQDETQISGVGISSVIDAVIFLRYAEAGGEINRLLLILKMRGSRHSNQYREYRISDQGIDVADVYVGEAGVLTGTARQVQEARDAEELRLQQLGVQQKEQEIAQNRSALKAAEAELERLQLEAKVRLDSVAQRSRMRGEDHDSERR